MKVPEKLYTFTADALSTAAMEMSCVDNADELARREGYASFRELCNAVDAFVAALRREAPRA